jgi:hypothetical protein
VNIDIIEARQRVSRIALAAYTEDLIWLCELAEGLLVEEARRSQSDSYVEIGSDGLRTRPADVMRVLSVREIAPGPVQRTPGVNCGDDSVQRSQHLIVRRRCRSLELAVDS